jgi:hypothetical protein
LQIELRKAKDKMAKMAKMKEVLANRVNPATYEAHKKQMSLWRL